ncbi:MAG: hypothetical protein VXX85_01700 [Candidatus Margulisiibacteriota bacterium]|nr:hypothetical protein [Candidatus Margulisiibacteriota bacterium]
MFADSKLQNSVTITSKDPVHKYQGKTFEEVFGSSPQISSFMTPIQRTIRQSIVHAKRNRNPKCIELCITLEHVETSDSLDSKLCELEALRPDLTSINNVFKNLVKTDNQYQNRSNQYKHEIILKGIEEYSLFNVIYLLMGFSEQIQSDFYSKATTHLMRLFDKDSQGKTRYDVINSKLYTIDFTKLSHISIETPFLIGSEESDLLSCIDGVSRYAIGIESAQNEYGKYKPKYGYGKNYTSVKSTLDDLMSDLFRSDYDCFDYKVFLLNRFDFDAQKDVGRIAQNASKRFKIEC